jgi:hypothetical protein
LIRGWHVFAAYGWPTAHENTDLSDDQILERLLALNLARSATNPSPLLLEKKCFEKFHPAGIQNVGAMIERNRSGRSKKLEINQRRLRGRILSRA